MTVPDFFPLNYQNARERFLALRQQAVGQKSLDTWHVPSATENDLYTDTLYLPPHSKKRTLFVFISGVHGLEAYAGHAIQAMALKEFFPKVIRAETGFYFVHSLNPYGFKHHRRNTEAGVNLNRNCSASPALYSIKNEESVRLSQRFIPARPVDGPVCELLRRRRDQNGKIFFEDVPLDDFIKSTGLGQYTDPTGLEFGGFGPEPQVTLLTKALREILPGYKDIVLFDLHTGLGERARLHLLTGDTEGCVHPDLFRELFDPANDRDVYEFTPADSEGFYQTHGATNNIFPELALTGQRVCAMTMEFGTLGHSLEAQMLSLNQWLLEHQGHFYGYATPELERLVRSDYLEKFFPRDPKWREAIIHVSREFLGRVFTRSHILL
jgi:hypothetical protein